MWLFADLKAVTQLTENSLRIHESAEQDKYRIAPTFQYESFSYLNIASTKVKEREH
jgi:hypothetical protein